MTEISNFHDKYFFLSNFYPSEIEFEGKSYPSVEHAFQAAKTFDPEQRISIQLAESPGQAKRLGRKVPLRSDWENVKFDLMLELLRTKFRDAGLQEQLLATGDATLIEGNTWNDRVWGCVRVKDKWVGKNWLGKLLTQVRDELREKEPR